MKKKTKRNRKKNSGTKLVFINYTTKIFYFTSWVWQQKFESNGKSGQKKDFLKNWFHYKYIFHIKSRNFHGDKYLVEF